MSHPSVSFVNLKHEPMDFTFHSFFELERRGIKESGNIFNTIIQIGLYLSLAFMHPPWSQINDLARRVEQNCCQCREGGSLFTWLDRHGNSCCTHNLVRTRFILSFGKSRLLTLFSFLLILFLTEIQIVGSRNPF